MTFICTNSKMREMFELWYVEQARTAYVEDSPEGVARDIELAQYDLRRKHRNGQYEIRDIQNLWAGWCAGIESLMKHEQWSWDR